MQKSYTKKARLLRSLLTLILLVSIAHLSYGQVNHTDTTQFTIKQSLKCFTEQKSLGVIIHAQDTIIQKQGQKIKNLEFLSDTLFKSNKSLTKINNDNKAVIETKNKWIKGLAYVATTEFIVLVILLIK